MLVLYKAVVLPHLEYCCQVWNPVAIGGIRKLEAVQRTFTARLEGLGHLNYWQRLQKLNLFSLERRRERYLAIYIWKIVKGLAPPIVSGGRSEIQITEGGRRGRLCVLPVVDRTSPASTQTLLEHSLPINGPRIFNALPRNLRDFDGSLETFKSKLDCYLQSVPDQPYLPHYYLPTLSNSVTTLMPK